MKKDYHEFNLKHDMVEPKVTLGMIFASTDLFNKAIRAHAVKYRQEVKFAKNDPNRVRAICKAPNCK